MGLTDKTVDNDKTSCQLSRAIWFLLSWGKPQFGQCEHVCDFRHLSCLVEHNMKLLSLTDCFLFSGQIRRSRSCWTGQYMHYGWWCAWLTLIMNYSLIVMTSYCRGYRETFSKPKVNALLTLLTFPCQTDRDCLWPSPFIFACIFSVCCCQKCRRRTCLLGCPGTSSLLCSYSVCPAVTGAGNRLSEHILHNTHKHYSTVFITNFSNTHD